MSASPVIVELVDFKNRNNIISGVGTFMVKEMSSSEDQVYNLIKMLKVSLATRFRKFSLDFDKVCTLEDIQSTGHSYDLVLSDDFDRLIVNQGMFLRVYNRSISAQQFNPKQLFEVQYNYNFRCMKLIKEKGMEFIYATNDANCVVKIQVSDIMKKDNRIIWSSNALQNVWGLDICKNYIYAIQYDLQGEISVLDCKNGEIQPNIEVPTLSIGYGIHMFSEKEILVTHSMCLEIFEKKNDIWESTRKSTFTMSTGYSIYYEDMSDLIYVSDSSGKQLLVVKRDDFSIVKSIDGYTMNFGMVIDKRSGLLYLCDTVAYSVIVYQ